MSAHTPEEIHALLAAAFNAGDLDAFVDLHERDATSIVPPNGVLAHGVDTIATAVRPVFGLVTRFRSDVVWKLEADGIAVTHARWSAAANADGDPIEMSGDGTIVSRRQPDGSWRILLDNPMGAD